MDIYEIFERGALANRGIDEIGTYNPMIERIKNDEIQVNEMKGILIDLYTAINKDIDMKIELLRNDIKNDGVDNIEQTYGLDDYSIAMIVSEELK